MVKKKAVKAKAVQVKKAGQAVGGRPTYTITCGKCDHEFDAAVPLHPDHRKATCPSCNTENDLRQS